MPEQSNNPEHSMHLRQRAEARLDATRRDLPQHGGRTISSAWCRSWRCTGSSCRCRMRNCAVPRSSSKRCVTGTWTSTTSHRPAISRWIPMGRSPRPTCGRRCYWRCRDRDPIGAPIILFIEPDDQPLFQDHCQVAFRTSLRANLRGAAAETRRQRPLPAPRKSRVRSGTRGCHASPHGPVGHQR